MGDGREEDGDEAGAWRRFAVSVGIDRRIARDYVSTSVYGYRTFLPPLSINTNSQPCGRRLSTSGASAEGLVEKAVLRHGPLPRDDRGCRRDGEGVRNRIWLSTTKRLPKGTLIKRQRMPPMTQCLPHIIGGSRSSPGDIYLWGGLFMRTSASGKGRIRRGTSVI